MKWFLKNKLSNLYRYFQWLVTSDRLKKQKFPLKKQENEFFKKQKIEIFL